MALTALKVSGYRSLRCVELPLQQLNVITGPNGSGKSNLYRVLWLIAQICEGQFARTLAREGGLLSAMWAGPRIDRKKPVRMSLGFRTDEFSFQLSCGYPQPSGSAFCYDPEIKEEAVWFSDKRKPSTTLLERKAGITTVRDVDGSRIQFPLVLAENESVLSQLREPHRYPELVTLREQVRGWRFYHAFRTDEDAPLRSPQVSVRTPALSNDGTDLAAALQTILEIGEAGTLHEAVASALPGRSLEIQNNQDQDDGIANAHYWTKSPKLTELSVALHTDGCQRPLLARELSDGTLKYLCLVAALLSPRPPGLIALNEPESSLHPDLLRPLARLIANAAQRSQVWVTTHSQLLAEAIREESGVSPVVLALREGETVIEEQTS